MELDLKFEPEFMLSELKVLYYVTVHVKMFDRLIMSYNKSLQQTYAFAIRDGLYAATD
jgi:hypothetical protein